MNKKYIISVLPGDGIGPELIKQAYKIIRKIVKCFKIPISTIENRIGGSAIDHEGTPLPTITLTQCEQSHAILLGSIGGPKWNTLPLHQQPERGGLLTLRKHFNLFANLRPAKTYLNLKNLSLFQSQKNNNICTKKINILCVRELIGGIYFGQPRGYITQENDEYAFNTEIYYRSEIERIANFAFKLARKRNRHLTSIDKANVLETSMLWRNTVNHISKKYPDVTLVHLYIDNAVIQLIKNPYQFDVILCSNLFGDIISDECAMLTGSIGMLPSASLNETGFGLYEPAGGSAPDIAGKNTANPIAQILSLALMFKYSLKLNKITKVIENAITKTLRAGYRTPDISINNKKEKIVGTDEMGDLVSEFITPNNEVI